MGVRVEVCHLWLWILWCGFWIGLFCFGGGFGACNVFGDLGWVV